jgi:DNA relaxase NicK
MILGTPPPCPGQSKLELNSLKITDPPSNTGSDSQLRARHGVEVGIDGLSLLWFGDLPILEHTYELIGCRFDFSKSHERRIGVLWNRCYVGTLGCLYSQRDTRDGICHRLSIGGQAFSRLPSGLVHRYIQIVSAYDEVRCSRIDIRADDYDRQLELSQISEALTEGNYSGFKYGSTIINHGQAGWTCYLGGRESQHFMRIYDKTAESEGRLDCIRLESEFKADRADAIFHSIAKENHCSATTIAKWIFGSFKFIERIDKNIKRCPLLTWWDSFVSRVTTESAVAVVERVKSSVERKKTWIERQVSKSLALIERAFGADKFGLVLEEMIAEGRSKLRRLDDLLVEEYLLCQQSAIVY